MATSSPSRKVQLPKDALRSVRLGHSFAEYDPCLSKITNFVRTPALMAAMDRTSQKCFFVGRRGTGKTATTYFLTQSGQCCVQVHPMSFVPMSSSLDVDALRDTRQRAFRSLVACFTRAIADEALSEWASRKLIKLDHLPEMLARERQFIEDFDFDRRLLVFQADMEQALASHAERDWQKLMNRARDVSHAGDNIGVSNGLSSTILLDRLDEAWDGSDKAVVFLMALMHACVQMTSSNQAIRVLLFLRENIFERVRQIDNEFARLETSVVSLDWSRPLLLEFIERRLQAGLTTKPALGGETWDCFFETTPSQSSRSLVFDFCQERPRDVLTYCSFAIDSAQAQGHTTVRIEDLQAARRRFSESRLKDLGDEYSENYPHLDLVLARFYGLGNEFTVGAITGLLKKLLVDNEIKNACATWLFRHTAPEVFIELLYNIGFCGIGGEEGVVYRSLGIKTPTPPAITPKTHVVVHPCFCDALSLREVIIGAIGDDVELRSEGIVLDLPEATSLTDYHAALDKVQENLETLPTGRGGAAQWEEIVGDVLRLCFFRFLGNVEAKSRDVAGTIVRDWIASNVAHSGFWEMVRLRYDATQVVWECKNYAELTADDFHQAAYYMSGAAGRFVVIVYRGQVERRYYEHIKRIVEKDGFVLLVTERDIKVFIRQARNGKLKEGHIRDIYDSIVRGVS